MRGRERREKWRKVGEWEEGGTRGKSQLERRDEETNEGRKKAATHPLT